MGQKYQYTSIERIFAKMTREGLPIIDEGDVIEYIGEALEQIGAVPYYEEAVAFIEIKDHQCPLPNGLHQINQIARNFCWKEEQKEDNICPADVIASCALPAPTNNCGSPGNPCPPNTLGIPLNCQGMPMVEYELAYYRPYFDLQSEYYLWSNSGLYQNCFRPVRLATSNFFLSKDKVDNTIAGAEGTLYDNGRHDEYTVIRKETIRTSFRCGQIALSYTRQPVDDNGYPLVPDAVEYTEAIVCYIAYKYAQKERRAGREGAVGREQAAMSDWQWYCKQARNMDLMPYGIDEHQNWYDARTRLLPNDRQYYGFFGKMARPEGRKFDDPDYRNYSLSYFRGVGANYNW